MGEGRAAARAAGGQRQQLHVYAIQIQCCDVRVIPGTFDLPSFYSSLSISPDYVLPWSDYSLQRLQVVFTAFFSIVIPTLSLL